MNPDSAWVAGERRSSWSAGVWRPEGPTGRGGSNGVLSLSHRSVSEPHDMFLRTRCVLGDTHLRRDCVKLSFLL